MKTRISAINMTPKNITRAFTHVVTKQKMCTAKLTSILILAVQNQCLLFPRNALLQRCATYIPSRTPSGQTTGKTPFARASVGVYLDVRTFEGFFFQFLSFARSSVWLCLMVDRMFCFFLFRVFRNFGRFYPEDELLVV